MSFTTLALLFWNIVLTVGLLYVWFFLRGFFPQKKRGIHQVIEDSIGRSERLDKELKTLSEYVYNHRELSKKAFQKLGLVKFNPFDRLGGEQSHCIALLNEDGAGVVITFLYTHEGVRVYVKDVLGKKGKQSDLSKEEEKAIENAS